jgi:hypothetical protein
MMLVYIGFILKASLIFLDLLFKRGYPPTKVRGLALTLEDRHVHAPLQMVKSWLTKFQYGLIF